MARWGEARTILDNLANQRRAIEIVQEHGECQYAYKALGVSRSSWQRYLKENEPFRQNCELAKQLHKAYRYLTAKLTSLQMKSADHLEELVNSGRAKESTMVKLALWQGRRKK